ncbi:hypothetical protein O6H91_03G107200 [Diphasiastrum complanatum]|uniref:Uncharacterized protein n=1 Tax=Diphasiastrum complanatum TaxID=34168 RepID=A0ACC2EA80_DIPCM|nr:hypothetical protein O6H91_03G107200 [Diphasiastrum complanatum]
MFVGSHSSTVLFLWLVKFLGENHQILQQVKVFVLPSDLFHKLHLIHQKFITILISSKVSIAQLKSCNMISKISTNWQACLHNFIFIFYMLRGLSKTLSDWERCHLRIHYLGWIS